MVAVEIEFVVAMERGFVFAIKTRVCGSSGIGFVFAIKTRVCGSSGRGFVFAIKTRVCGSNGKRVCVRNKNEGLW